MDDNFRIARDYSGIFCALSDSDVTLCSIIQTELKRRDKMRSIFGDLLFLRVFFSVVPLNFCPSGWYSAEVLFGSTLFESPPNYRLFWRRIFVVFVCPGEWWDSALKEVFLHVHWWISSHLIGRRTDLESTAETGSLNNLTPVRITLQITSTFLVFLECSLLSICFKYPYVSNDKVSKA